MRIIRRYMFLFILNSGITKDKKHFGAYPPYHTIHMAIGPSHCNYGENQRIVALWGLVAIAPV